MSTSKPPPSSSSSFEPAGVELTDAEPVVEVVVRYGDTVLDVSHVGPPAARTLANARALTIFGSGLLCVGIGLFAHEVAQDWDDYNQRAVAAMQSGALAPPQPGWGVGGVGIALALLGLVPLVAGSSRSRTRDDSTYTVGEGHHASFHMPTAGLPDPTAFPLVDTRGGRPIANFTLDMLDELRIDGHGVSAERALERGRIENRGSHQSLALTGHTECRLQAGPVGFHIRAVPPGRRPSMALELDRPFLVSLGATAALSTAMFGLVLSIPDSYLDFEFEENVGENRFAKYIYVADEVDPPEPTPTASEDLESGGGSGGRHAGHEGAMGNPRANVAARGVYASKGPRQAVPRLARDFDPDLAARKAGVLGLLAQSSGHMLSSPFGDAFAVGNDDEDIWGSLKGDRVGEAFGGGGLGLVGTGVGGGGTGEGTIGLDHAGMIGKGGLGSGGIGYGTGRGTGFGARKGRVPRVRTPRAVVRGQMDKSIIRRIVRSHINEVRSCYNRGLTRNPHLSGRVSVNFMINVAGRVPTSVVQSSDLKDRSVANCIAKAVKRWRFPRPRGGGNAIVTYPFALSPG